MFYFYTFIYSLKSCFKPEFPSSAKHKRYFEEGGKPNSCWSTVTSIVFFSPTFKVNVDQQLFGYHDSSKYLLTDVNACGAVQYIDTAAPELKLIECALSHDMIFLQKQIVETFFIRAAAGQMGAQAGFYCCAPSLKYYGSFKNHLP